jgi:LuxR family maltose regulon positive regulatory protein
MVVQTWVRKHHLLPMSPWVNREATCQTTLDMTRGALSEPSSLADDSLAPIVDTKLHMPRARGFVLRPRLLDRLSASDARLALVAASPGTGKSTVLAHWTARDDRRAFAWVTIDPGDNDPARVWAHILEALERVGLQSSEGLRSGVREVDRRDGFLPGLVNALAGSERQIVLVLDDYHHLSNGTVHAELAYFVEHVPDNCRVAIGTRLDPPLPLARLRASGDLVELRDHDLRFTDPEAAELLRGELGVAIGGGAVDAILARTEGWAVGLYLAALALRGADDIDTAVSSFGGVRRHVVDYFVDEVLDGLDPERRTFLLESSVLERLSGDLCDFVLEREGSAELLETLVRSNKLVVPLDEDRHWYRYHNLLAEFLRGELGRGGSDRLMALHRRAATWLERAGLLEEAVSHAILSREVETVGRLVAGALIPLERLGRGMTIAGWLAQVDVDRIELDTRLAITSAWMALNRGDTETAERWLDVAEGRDEDESFDGTASIGVVTPMTRAVSAYFRGAPTEAARRAEQAIDAGPPSVWRARAAVILGASLYWRGELGRARAHFERLLPRLEGESIPRVIALSYLGQILLEEGDVDGARAQLERGRALAQRLRLDRHLRTAGTYLALCRVAIRDGDPTAARELVAADLEPMRNRLEPAQHAALLLVEARVSMALGEADAAEELLARAEDVVQMCDEWETIAERLAALEPAFGLTRARPTPSMQGLEQLSPRELDVLRLLPTRLSKREIGRELYVSPDTIGTHTKAIYRKLGVHSRADAVASARALGLL